VRDINGDGIFRTTRVVNPLDPQYVYDVPKSEYVPLSILTLLFVIVYKHLSIYLFIYLSLFLHCCTVMLITYGRDGTVQDAGVVGSVPGSKPRIRHYEIRNGVDPLNTRDVPGATAGWQQQRAMEGRRHFRNTNFIADIDGAQVWLIIG